MKLETFFNKFDQLADAPDAVEKMRALVMNLAVRGALVAQDRDDEPAEASVERVSKDAKKAIRDGIIRRHGLEEAPDDGDLSELPSGWRWTRLVEVTRPVQYAIKRGPFGSAIRKDMFVPSGFKVYEQQHAISGDFTKGRYYINETKFDELSAFELHPDEILVSCSGTVGKVAIVPANIERGIINQALLKLSLHQSAVLNEYFLILFPAFFMETDTLTNLSGTAQKNIPGMDVLKAMPFPLPPLAEQKRIVAKVDELMALCDRLALQQQAREEQASQLARAALARFADAPTPANLNTIFHASFPIPPSDLRKSILTLAVQGKLVPQDPNDEPAEELLARIEGTKEKLIKQRTIKRVSVEPNPSEDAVESLPSGWLWTRLGNAFDVRDGTHDTPKYATEGFPLITSKNIYSGKLLFDGANLISEKDHRQICERSRVNERDILFAMIGSIGNPVIVDTDREFSIKNVALFKYYSAADSEPRFLLQYLQLVSEEMKAKAAGGVQSFVSLGFLRNYPFPLPPLAEQRRIVAKVDELMALVDALETQLATARTTATALLAAAVAELTTGKESHATAEI